MKDVNPKIFIYIHLNTQLEHTETNDPVIYRHETLCSDVSYSAALRCVSRKAALPERAEVSCWTLDTGYSHTHTHTQVCTTMLVRALTDIMHSPAPLTNQP